MNNIFIEQAKSFINKEDPLISIVSNLNALIYETFPNLNWVGFYFYSPKYLYLGPFVGKVACTRLDLNKGVCAKAITTNTIQNIPDVHAFPGHIACDSASNSELVFPIYINNQPYAVLDIDSHTFNNFDDKTVNTINEVIQILTDFISELDELPNYYNN